MCISCIVMQGLLLYRESKKLEVRREKVVLLPALLNIKVFLGAEGNGLR